MTKLLQVRKEHHMTRQEVSYLTGIPLRTLEAYEQGRRSLRKASFTVGLRLAAVYAVSVWDLLDPIE